MALEIDVSSDVFIVPNIAGSFIEYCNHTRRYMLEIVKLNDIDLYADDKIIEVWFTSPEVSSESITDHGFTTIVDGYEVDISSYNLKYVPAKIFDGAKEGDVIKYVAVGKGFVKRPNGVSLGKSFEEIEVIIDFTLTCRQEGYQYSTHGKFEEVFKWVTKVNMESPDDNETVDNYEKSNSGTNVNKENKNEKGKFTMFNAIKEKWNNLPKGVKTGLKVVGGVAVVAAVSYAGKVGYDKYCGQGESPSLDMVNVEENTDVVIIDSDDSAVVITPE